MRVDKSIFYLTIILITISIIFVYSLSIYKCIHTQKVSEFHFFIRQLIAGGLGIVLMWYISRLNPDKYFIPLGAILFGVFLFLMSIMQFLPPDLVKAVNGAKRWIKTPLGLSVAPVEFFKIGFVFFLAWSFARRLSEHKKTLKEEIKLILPYIGVFLVAVYLIAILQNDLGQVVVLALTLAVMAFFAGTSAKLFILSILGAIAIATFAITTSTHRILRIKTWWATIQNMVLSIFPDSIANTLRVHDAPEPWQISHSLNAIKHGGLFGMGIGGGTFKLGFLSEVHTDFVLAGMSEEVGAIGVTIITLSIIAIIYRIFKIANRSKDRVYYLFALGIALLIAFSFLMNAYGVTSLIPIKGIAVPFLSYGGSSMLALSIGIGLVLMISKKADLK